MSKKISTKTGNPSYATYHFERGILESVLENNFTEDDWENARKYFRGGCAYCGEKIERRDHVVPVKDFGDFVPGNVIPACQKCDDSKGKKDFRDWMGDKNVKNSPINRNVKSIEKRIERIEKFLEKHNYSPKTAKQIFGKHFDEFEALKVEMTKLEKKARGFIDKVNGK